MSTMAAVNEILPRSAARFGDKIALVTPTGSCPTPNWTGSPAASRLP
ncbi:hypothetical protein [Amycolatopsis jejuensis]|nr:hypothetical protein [Amycolatopsis jejuensis]